MKPETERDRDIRIARAIALGGVPAEVTRPVDPDEVARAHAAAVLKLGGGATLSRAEIWLAENSAQEQLLRANLNRVIKHTVAERIARYELAEVLKRLGRLNEAIELAPKRRSEFLRLKDAIEKGDDVDCTCEDFIIPVAHPTQPALYPIKNKIFPRYIHVDTLYSYRHETLVALTQCCRCNDWNARASLPALMAERAALAGQFPQSGAGSDYDTLPDAPFNA